MAAPVSYPMKQRREHTSSKGGEYWRGMFYGVLPLAVVAAIISMALRFIRFNKHTLNPTTLKSAGHRTSIYAAVKHVGRRSGRIYTTPVVAKPLGDGFVIPLPYEASVDWCRNVLEASTCTLLWNEQEYIMERPEMLSLSGTMKAFTPLTRLLYAVGGVKQYLWLHQRKEVAETVSTPEAASLSTSALSAQ